MMEKLKLAKPPKLTVEGIRSFLQRSLKSSDQGALVFLKSLVVSKTFLNVARHYSIYTFCVYTRESGQFKCSFANEIASSEFKRTSDLPEPKVSSRSFARTLKLINFFNPKNFCMIVDDSQLLNNFTGQCELLFNFIHNGKIRLHFKGHQFDRSAILRQLAPRLNVLECDFETLENANVISSFNLDYYVTHSTLNKEQFKTLLRYNILSIFVDRVVIDDEIGVEVLSLEQSQVNSVLRRLEIWWFSDSYAFVPKLFNFLKQHCQRLRSLDISFPFHDDKLCPQDATLEIDEILKNLPLIHEKLKKLQEYCESMPLSNFFHSCTIGL